MAGSLDVSQALTLLDRLKKAAPDTTASNLGLVIALIRELSDENAYLNVQMAETLLQADVSYQPPPLEAQPQPAPPANGATSSLDMLAGMNDALRPPLVAIRGRAELIQAGMLGQITGEQATWLNAIQENADRSFRLLDAIQRLIAINQQQVRIDWSNFIASDLLEAAYDRIQDQASAAKHKLTIHIPDVVPLAQGDFYQSLMVLTDLLDNAVRYTPAGGTIRLSADSLGTHVLFSVADNGIGLEPTQMQTIAQPFWRGDDHPQVRQHSGTGLSLFLAQQTLALQGGELIYSGEPDLGSTFSFTLAVPS